MTKACKDCGDTKPLDEYHRAKQNRDGRQGKCKACMSARSSIYRAQPEVKAARAEYTSGRNARPEVKARQAEHAAKHHAENREAIRVHKAAYRAENPHIAWEAHYRHRALRHGFDYLIPSMQRVTREDLIRIHGDKCRHCGGPFESADHWPIPVSQGGHHAAYNMVPSCMDCQPRTWRAYKPSTETTTASSAIDTTNDRNN